jgi:uncharacterized protein
MIMPFQQQHITFEDIDTALRQIKNAAPAAFAVGVIYGSVCAPHMVPPSVYLRAIFGNGMEMPDLETAERVYLLLNSLHNQLVMMVEDHVLLNVRRKSFETDKEGMMGQVSDLWREVYGFRKGLSLGTYAESDFPKAALRHYDQLGDEQTALKALIRRIEAKRKPYTAQESEERLSDIETHRKKTAQLMRSIATALYKDRMKHYKAAGSTRIGRNDPCPCGSGKKFKQCCLDKIDPTNIGNN